MASSKVVRSLNLDPKSQKEFVEFYYELGEKQTTTLRIFDHKDFYSVHGKNDTEIVSKMVFESLAHIKTMSIEGYPDLSYVVLRKGNFENVAREMLVVRNYTIEMYSKSNVWQLEFKGSPGNYSDFEELLFNYNEITTSNSVIAVQLKEDDKQIKVGLACAETNDSIFSVAEFNDDEYFANLEASIVLLNPKECILPASNAHYGRIKKLMERNSVTVTLREKSEFILEKTDLVQQLNSLLRFKNGQQVDSNMLPEMEYTVAISALGAIIKYLDLISNTTNNGSFEMKTLDLHRFVHLDNAAIDSLNIIPLGETPIYASSCRYQSILGVLDRCRTAQGHRLMAQWVKQPLRDETIIKNRHNIVECLLENVSVLNTLYDNQLKGIPDIMMLAKKLLRKTASLQDVYRIYQIIIRIPRFIIILNELENTSVQDVICEPLTNTLKDLKMFKVMVEQVIDFDTIDQDDCLIKPTLYDELKGIKKRMDVIKDKMSDLYEEAVDELNMEKGSLMKLEFVSHLGYHFRISLKNDSAIRNNKKYKMLDALKGGIRFTTDKLTEYNEKYTEYRETYKKQQKTAVDEIIRIAIGYMGPLTCLSNSIAQIDCLVSFAIAARSAPTPYVRPKILPEGSGILSLKNLRHPCLELQEDMTYVANDVDLKKDKTNMYIITGPNMGGKSTYIRSIGIAVLMAHIGSFISCDEGTISMVDSILSRVGAGDSIEKGMSTFMMEMVESSTIMRIATNKSLVIIDELGRGTSTYDGCGIAWSIAESLARDIKCLTLFATHFHEIIKLPSYVSTVKNYHMATIAEGDNFTILYKVQPGAVDKSFGLHIARIVNFPDSVLDEAQQRYENYGSIATNLKDAKEDEAAEMIKNFQDKITNIPDGELEEIINDFYGKIRKIDSKYLKAAFPQLF